MELKYKGQFKRDIDGYSLKILNAVRDAILSVKAANDLTQINNLKKLKRHTVYYRIKIAENYRIGLIIRKNTVWFARFGHRSTFYKYFP